MQHPSLSLSLLSHTRIKALALKIKQGYRPRLSTTKKITGVVGKRHSDALRAVRERYAVYVKEKMERERGLLVDVDEMREEQEERTEEESGQVESGQIESGEEESGEEELYSTTLSRYLSSDQLSIALTSPAPAIELVLDSEMDHSQPIIASQELGSEALSDPISYQRLSAPLQSTLTRFIDKHTTHTNHTTTRGTVMEEEESRDAVDVTRKMNVSESRQSEFFAVQCEASKRSVGQESFKSPVQSPSRLFDETFWIDDTAVVSSSNVSERNEIDERDVRDQRGDRRSDQTEETDIELTRGGNGGQSNGWVPKQRSMFASTQSQSESESDLNTSIEEIRSFLVDDLDILAQYRQ